MAEQPTVEENGFHSDWSYEIKESELEGFAELLGYLGWAWPGYHEHIRMIRETILHIRQKVMEMEEIAAHAAMPPPPPPQPVHLSKAFSNGTTSTLETFRPRAPQPSPYGISAPPLHQTMQAEAEQQLYFSPNNQHHSPLPPPPQYDHHYSPQPSDYNYPAVQSTSYDYPPSSTSQSHTYNQNYTSRMQEDTDYVPQVQAPIQRGGNYDASIQYPSYESQRR
ncbi:hypothetical protein T439DRAFT_145985 [Meredithblackwellia eburnea MCA 4105]